MEEIPVYWISLVWVPKGFLDTINRLCYKFIWSRDEKNKGLVLASWKQSIVPKENGGWGLKNPFFFSKALAAKNVWRIK
jgi:hypothetical protein